MTKDNTMLAELIAMRARGEISQKELEAARKVASVEFPNESRPSRPQLKAGGHISFGRGMMIIGIALPLFMFVAFASSWFDTEQKTPRSDGISPQGQADPLHMMETVFVGNHSRTTIEYELRRTMQYYGSPTTSSEMLRWSNVLVALRRANRGVTEMGMLRCMYDMRRSSSNVSIPYYDAAALCATGMAVGG